MKQIEPGGDISFRAFPVVRSVTVMELDEPGEFAVQFVDGFIDFRPEGDLVELFKEHPVETLAGTVGPEVMDFGEPVTDAQFCEQPRRYEQGRAMDFVRCK